MRITVIYGPSKTGKTKNKKFLQRKFKHKHVKDGWDGKNLLRDDTLAITNVAPPYPLPEYKAVHIADVALPLAKPNF